MPLLPGIGVITLDTGLRVRSWSEWMAAATGVPASVARDRHVVEFAPASRAEIVNDELLEVLRSGATRVLVPAFHRFLVLCPPPYANAHFQEMQQRVTLAPLRDETSTVGIIITIEDVTPRLIEERERARRIADGVDGAGALVAQAGAGDWQARAAATRSLKQSATESEIAELLEALEHEHHDFSVLSGALQVITASHGDVTAPLVRLLKHPTANVRMHAALALGALGDETAAAALVAALDDDDSNVRFHAIEALGRLAAPEAVPALQRIAESGDFFLAFPAVDALGRIDDAGVVPALMALLDFSDLRPAVIDALAALGDEDCVALLVALLNDGRADAAQAATALTAIARRYHETFGAAGFIADVARAALSPDGVARLAAAAADGGAAARPVLVVLGWVGEPGLDALVAAVGDPAVRAEVTEAILNIGAPAVTRLMAQVEHGSREARVAAVFLLGAIGDIRARPALRAALSSHDNELVTTAVRAIAALGDREALDALLALFAHQDTMVRQAAIAALNSLGADGTEARLSGLLDDPDARVRECAVRASGYFAFRGCTDGILRALIDDVEDVRRAAIEQLPLLDSSRTADCLLAALTGETPRNRAAAAHALRLVDGTGVAAALLEALGDEYPWVRYFAAGSVAHHGATAAVETLEAMARIDAAPYVRIAAIHALAQLDVPAVTRVAAIVAADSDEEVAAAAIHALAVARGREVEALLERFVQSPAAALRLAAVRVLGTMGTPAAIQTLAWAARLADPPVLADAAMDGLRRVAESAPETAATAIAALLHLGLNPATRERALQLLSSLPARAVPALTGELAARAPGIRGIGVEVLARMRTPEATEHVAAALADPDASVRALAVNAFGRLGSSGIAERIVAMSHDDPDASVRRRATVVCRRYGWMPGTRAVGTT